MKRTLLVVALGAASISAYASFELVLVADGVKNTIHRFDGESGTYLGSFGKVNSTTWGNGSSMVLIQSRNEVVVNYGANLVRYNYNTGALVGNGTYGLVPTNVSLSRDGKTIYACNATNQIFRFSADTFSAMTPLTYTTGMKIYSAAETNNINLVGQDVSKAGTVSIRRFGLDQTVSGTTNFVGTGGQMTATPYNDISWWAGNANDWSKMGVAFAVGGAAMGLSGQVTATGLGTGYIDIPFGDVTLTNAKSIAAAHQGFYAGGTNAAGTNLVYRLDNGLSSQGVFGSGIIGSNIAMASVVAPEPGSILALAMGAGLLIRRRSGR